MATTLVKIERLKSEPKTNTATIIGIGLNLQWSDGRYSTIDSAALRKNCPCAECIEKRGGGESHSKPLSKKSTLLKVLTATLEEETDLQEVWPVGNYAIGIRWGDKHDSGIFSYEYLLKLTDNTHL